MSDDPETTSFKAEGFLQEGTRHEFLVEGHELDNSSGLLGIKIVVAREAGDDVVRLATKQGLEMNATFDPDHPDLVMLETIGLLNHVEHLAKDLAAAGYHRLAERL